LIRESICGIASADAVDLSDIMVFRMAPAQARSLFLPKDIEQSRSDLVREVYASITL
jgi:hypothetical protein